MRIWISLQPAGRPHSLAILLDISHLAQTIQFMPPTLPSLCSFTQACQPTCQALQLAGEPWILLGQSLTMKRSYLLHLPTMKYLPVIVHPLAMKYLLPIITQHSLATPGDPILPEKDWL